MSTTEGPNNSSAVTTSGSGVSWSNTADSIVDNSAFADSNIANYARTNKDTELYILDDSSSQIGNNKANVSSIPVESTPSTYTTYGGTNDLWGATLTASVINSSNFGFRIGYGFDTSTISDYLDVSNFGFSIPTGATIEGVEFEVSHSQWDLESLIGIVDVRVRHVRATIHYSIGGSATSVSSTLFFGGGI